MKINIILNDFGWVYEKFFMQIKKLSKYDIVLNDKLCNDEHINYFLPYYEFFTSNKKSVAWFSHMEPKDPLKSKFIAIAHNVNVCISHSKKYADILKSNGVQNIVQIMPGIDLKKFIIKPQFNKRSKLIIGFIGRQYASNRKNPSLLKKIENLSFVELRCTNGKINEKDLPDFYNDLDLICSPALIEGGPICINEGLACGIPIICFEGVGVVDEFLTGVIKVSSENDFINRIKELWTFKEYLRFKDPQIRSLMRQQVENLTWENFVKQHDIIFERLINE